MLVPPCADKRSLGQPKDRAQAASRPEEGTDHVEADDGLAALSRVGRQGAPDDAACRAGENSAQTGEPASATRESSVSRARPAAADERDAEESTHLSAETSPPSDFMNSWLRPALPSTKWLWNASTYERRTGLR